MTKRRAIWTGVSTAIIGFATVLGAQTTSAPQSATTANTEAQITVIGCLKQAPVITSASPGVTTSPPAVGTAGTTGAAGTAGTTGTAGTARAAIPPAAPVDNNAAALTFTLTNATTAPADASSTTSTASTTGAPAATSGSAGQTYRLIANPGALTPLVGKKLALTGVLDPQDNAARSTEASAGPDANAPVLRVKSGKIVAASCQ